MDESLSADFPSVDPPLDAAVLRLLDANANRAREALRVLEDYARFVLDDADLSRDLKNIRHGLVDALRDDLLEAILHRDTPGDVGTANKTDSELTRDGVQDVVVAAGKRLGEALRSIEEFAKTLDPWMASTVESLRYAFYEIERRLAFSFRRTASQFEDVRLYVLVTESVCKGPWLKAAEEAIIGGADCVQLREKDLESGEFLRRARALVDLCHELGVLCIINDRPDIAVLSGADGVHVGQGDLPATEARKIVGPRKLVGVSTHNLSQAKQAVRDGADYIGVGPFFRSPTKPRDFTAGPEYARQAAEQIAIPSVAIAGITAGNVDEVLATGVRAVAVSSAVVGADDVRAAAAELKEKLQVGVPKDPSRRPPIGGQAFLPVSRVQSPPSNARGRASPASRTSDTAPPSGGQAFLPVSRERNPPSKTKDPVGPESGTPGRGRVTRRHLPHWELPGATYFVTFRLLRGDLDKGERHVVLSHIKAGHATYYALIAAVVMPDHVHMLLTPIGEYTIGRVMQGTKGATARLLNQRWNRQGPVWQDESWDRVMRTREDVDERLQYMLNNPVRKGLSADGWAWDGWYYNKDWK